MSASASQHVAEIVGLNGTDLLVIQLENRLVIVIFEMEQREMPGDMKREIVAFRPDRSRRRQPFAAFIDPAFHFEDVGDGVKPPTVGGLNFDGTPADGFGLIVRGGFFQAESMASKQETVARAVLRHSAREIAGKLHHAVAVAQHEAERMGDLGAEEIAGMSFEVAFQTLCRHAHLSALGEFQRVEQGGFASRRTSLCFCGCACGFKRFACLLQGFAASEHDPAKPHQRVCSDQIRIGFGRLRECITERAVSGNGENGILKGGYRVRAIAGMHPVEAVSQHR
jgi:hypothetical protein